MDSLDNSLKNLQSKVMSMLYLFISTDDTLWFYVVWNNSSIQCI